MALVFVHGIGNRSGPAYANKVALRDALFRRFLLTRAFPGLAESPIHNPMWGNSGARLAWDHAALPDRRRGERLGAGDQFVADLLAAVDPEGVGQPLLQLARRDLRDAIDLLYTFVDLRGRDGMEIEELADLAEALTDWCDRHETDDRLWLAEVDDDRELIEALARRTTPARQQIAGRETLGGRGGLRTSAHAVLTAAVDRYRQQNVGPPTRYAAAALRRLAGRPLSLLIGDVLTYLGTRGGPESPGEIVSLVAGSFEEALQDGPLVVVAHSMGGNIAYDILSHLRPDIEVDTFVTVGSQVGLFEELKLFGASNGQLPNTHTPRVPPLPNVKCWINVVDRGDVLAYRAATVFDGVADYEYPTDAPWAHGAYFRQPNFHARLAARVQEARA